MNRTPFPTPRVRVCHAYPLVACGLARVLGEMGDVEVLVDGCDDAVADVVVTDYDAGLALAVRARRDGATRRPVGPKVVILTERCREQDVRTALEAGVAGYLQQDCTSAQVADCIRKVAAGLRYIESDLAMRMAAGLSQESLTSRECEVLAEVAQGRANKMIATELGISVGTVKAHLKAIMSKLQAASRTEAASIALKRGLVDDRPRRPRAVSAPPWAARARAESGAGAAMQAG